MPMMNLTSCSASVSGVLKSYRTLFILVSIIERFESEMILSFGDLLT
jgi:hypothetical protein